MVFTGCDNAPRVYGRKDYPGSVAGYVRPRTKPTAVVVSAEEYARLTRRRGRLSAALLRPEFTAEDLDISRSRDTGRDVGLRAGCWTPARFWNTRRRRPRRQ